MNKKLLVLTLSLLIPVSQQELHPSTQASKITAGIAGITAGVAAGAATYSLMKDRTNNNSSCAIASLIACLGSGTAVYLGTRYALKNDNLESYEEKAQLFNELSNSSLVRKSDQNFEKYVL